MHVLIPVFFHAPSGGLHENVRDTARFLLARRHKVTVVCKPGPFAERVTAAGGKTVITDFGPVSLATTFDAIRALHCQQPIDLVHARPFAARHLGVMVARVLGIPCVITIHGQYLDALRKSIRHIDAVFTVSEGIRQYLVAEQAVPNPEKFYVVPNGVDVQLFRAVRVAKSLQPEEKLTISLVSRLDKDKAFILEVFLLAVEHAAQLFPGRVHWQIVGQGTLRADLATRLERCRGENSVSFTGWLQDEALRDAYGQSDAVIGPGRCALEAMSSGVPTIALGSKSYVGLISPETWQAAVYTNFGGLKSKTDGYAVSSIARDLDRVLSSASERRRLGRFGRQLALQFFNTTRTQKNLFDHYRFIIWAHRLRAPPEIPAEDFLELRVRDVQLEQLERDYIRIVLHCRPAEGLKYAWHLYRNDELIQKHPFSFDPEHIFRLPGEGGYKVRCFIRDSAGRTYSFYSLEATQDEY